MGMKDLPDIYALAQGHIYQTNSKYPCYINDIHQLGHSNKNCQNLKTIAQLLHIVTDTDCDCERLL